MRMRRGLAVIFLMLLANVSIADDYTKEDFGYGFPLETDGKGAVYSITLPHDVYASAVTADLRDIKVFNAQGQAVPHELGYADDEEQPITSRVSLPFFPLSSANGEGSTAVSVRVETGDEGEIIRVRRTRDRSTKTPASYLFDIKKVEKYPATLHFRWKSDGPKALLPVVLESSEDLMTWRKVTQATLADLVFLGSRLKNAKIELDRPPERYLRLKPDGRGELPRISAVSAVSTSASDRHKRRWSVQAVSVSEEDGKTYLLVAFPGTLPLDALDLAFPQPNSLLKLQAQSLDPNDIWHNWGEMVFYRLSSRGKELANTPMRLNRRTVEALKLEVIENGVGDTLGSVKVRLGYIPQELLFVARGKGPFLLAYGNAGMGNKEGRKGRLSLGEIADSDRQGGVGAARVGERIVLAGEEALVLPGPNPWNARLLWLALFAGVAVLAVMAWSLARQIKR